MPIEKILDLGTCHLTATDARLLGEYDVERPPSLTLIAYPYEYGWTVSTSGLSDPDMAPDFEKGAHAEGFSETFLAILRSAAGMGAVMVRFDRDGDEEPGFPIFEW